MHKAEPLEPTTEKVLSQVGFLWSLCWVASCLLVFVSMRECFKQNKKTWIKCSHQGEEYVFVFSDAKGECFVFPDCYMVWLEIPGWFGMLPMIGPTTHTASKP